MVRSFRDFCFFIEKNYEERYPEWDGTVTMHVFQEFALWLFRTRGISRNSIKIKISCVNAVLNEKGWGLNLHNYSTEGLNRLLRGADRIRRVYDIGRQQVARRALTDLMLNRMLAQIDMSNRFQRTMHGCILFGKQTGFRSHNFVWTKNGGFVCIKHLKLGYTNGKLTTIVVTLPTGKTHQLDNVLPETRTLRCQCKRGLCAVHAVWRLIRRRLDRVDEAVFVNPNGHPITYNQLRKTMKAMAEMCGLNPRHYTPHALRIGQATDMHMQGKSIPRIMKYMGWVSRKSAMIYIRPDNADFVQFGINE